jgi:hypothetical protein
MASMIPPFDTFSFPISKEAKEWIVVSKKRWNEEAQEWELIPFVVGDESAVRAAMDLTASNVSNLENQEAAHEAE